MRNSRHISTTMYGILTISAVILLALLWWSATTRRRRRMPPLGGKQSRREDKRQGIRIGLSEPPSASCGAGFTGLYCEACMSGMDYPWTECMRDPPTHINPVTIGIPLSSPFETCEEVHVAARTWTPTRQYTVRAPVRVQVGSNARESSRVSVAVSSILSTTLPVQFALTSPTGGYISRWSTLGDYPTHHCTDLVTANASTTACVPFENLASDRKSCARAGVGNFPWCDTCVNTKAVFQPGTGTTCNTCKTPARMQPFDSQACACKPEFEGELCEGCTFKGFTQTAQPGSRVVLSSIPNDNVDQTTCKCKREFGGRGCAKSSKPPVLFSSGKAPTGVWVTSVEADGDHNRQESVPCAVFYIQDNVIITSNGGLKAFVEVREWDLTTGRYTDTMFRDGIRLTNQDHGTMMTYRGSPLNEWVEPGATASPQRRGYVRFAALSDQPTQWQLRMVDYLGDQIAFEPIPISEWSTLPTGTCTDVWRDPSNGCNYFPHFDPATRACDNPRRDVSNLCRPLPKWEEDSSGNLQCKPPLAGAECQDCIKSSGIIVRDATKGCALYPYATDAGCIPGHTGDTCSRCESLTLPAGKCGGPCVYPTRQSDAPACAPVTNSIAPRIFGITTAGALHYADTWTPWAPSSWTAAATPPSGNLADIIWIEELATWVATSSTGVWASTDGDTWSNIPIANVTSAGSISRHDKEDRIRWGKPFCMECTNAEGFTGLALLLVSLLEGRAIFEGSAIFTKEKRVVTKCGVIDGNPTGMYLIATASGIWSTSYTTVNGPPSLGDSFTLVSASHTCFVNMPSFDSIISGGSGGAAYSNFRGITAAITSTPVHALYVIEKVVVSLSPKNIGSVIVASVLNPTVANYATTYTYTAVCWTAGVWIATGDGCIAFSVEEKPALWIEKATPTPTFKCLEVRGPRCASPFSGVRCLTNDWSIMYVYSGFRLDGTAYENVNLPQMFIDIAAFNAEAEGNRQFPISTSSSFDISKLYNFLKYHTVYVSYKRLPGTEPFYLGCSIGSDCDTNRDVNVREQSLVSLYPKYDMNGQKRNLSYYGEGKECQLGGIVYLPMRPQNIPGDIPQGFKSLYIGPVVYTGWQRYRVSKFNVVTNPTVDTPGYYITSQQSF